MSVHEVRVLLWIFIWLTSADADSSMYISPTGTDSPFCGGLSHPCKTITRAYNNVKPNNKHADREVIFYLACHNEKPISYELPEEIVLLKSKGNIKITKASAYCTNPVLTGKTKSIFLWQLRDFVSINIDSIDFQNIRILRTENIQDCETKHYVNITNCNIVMEYGAAVFFKQTKSLPKKCTARISINNVTVTSETRGGSALLRFTNSVPLSNFEFEVTRSVLIKTGIVFRKSRKIKLRVDSKNALLRIDQVKFQNPPRPMVFVNVQVDVSITNSVFTGKVDDVPKDLITLRGVEEGVQNLLISNCTFDSVYIRCNRHLRKKKMTVYPAYVRCIGVNCTFTNLTITHCNATINGITLENGWNTIKDFRVTNTYFGKSIVFGRTAITVTISRFTLSNNVLKHFLNYKSVQEIKLSQGTAHGNVFTGAAFHMIGTGLSIINDLCLIDNVLPEIFHHQMKSKTNVELFRMTNVYIEHKSRVPSEKPLLDVLLNADQIIMHNVTIKTNQKERTVFLIEAWKGRKRVSLKSFTIICNSKSSLLESKYSKGGFSIRCKSCQNGFYNIRGDSANISKIIKKKAYSSVIGKLIKAHSTAKCNACPYGGNCDSGEVRIIGNYFRVAKKDQITLAQCPNGYCCSPTGRNCSSSHKCSNNRNGTLCGKCRTGFQEDFYSNNCRPISTCSNVQEFWIFQSATAVIILLVCCFLPDMMNFLLSILKRNSNDLKTVEEKTTKITITKKESTSHSEAAGVPREANYLLDTFLLIVSFYQMKSLLLYNINSQPYSHWLDLLHQVLHDFMNFDASITYIAGFCPVKGLDAISKAVLANLALLSIVTWLLLTLLCICVTIKTIRLIWSRSSSSGVLDNYKKDTFFIGRIMMSFITVLMLAYKNIALLSFTLVSCTTVDQSNVLFMYGETNCYTQYQYCVLVFIVMWVLPFPLTLSMAYKQLKEGKFTTTYFVLSVTVPPFYIICYLLTRSSAVTTIPASNMDMLMTRYSKEILEGPYNEGKTVWACFHLYQRLLVVVIATHITNPFLNISLKFLIIITLTMLQIIVKPYRYLFSNQAETVSMLLLTAICAGNILTAIYEPLEDHYQTARVGSVVRTFDCIKRYASPIIFLLVSGLKNGIVYVVLSLPNYFRFR